MVYTTVPKEADHECHGKTVHAPPSEAVRLPKEFRFEGTEVRVSKVGNKVILEPLKKSRSMRPRGARGSRNTGISRSWKTVAIKGPFWMMITLQP